MSAVVISWLSQSLGKIDVKVERMTEKEIGSEKERQKSNLGKIRSIDYLDRPVFSD